MSRGPGLGARGPETDGYEALAPEILDELLRQLLDEGLDVRLRLSGSSMSPFLRGGDVVVLRRRSRPAGLGDVVAVRRGERWLVVHRVVAHEGGSVVTRGDASSALDDPVDVDDVLAVVTGAERRGRRVRLGLGAGRRLIAWLSRRGWLVPALGPLRRLARLAGW